MSKEKLNFKKHSKDFIICFIAMIIAIIIFGVYFYNVFVKFQLDYAKLYNNSVLEKSTELHNDIIVVSNSFFADSKTNEFINNPNKTIDVVASDYIKNRLETSTIKTLIDHVVINIPKISSVYSTFSNKKLSTEEFLQNYPEFDKAIQKDLSGMNIYTSENSNVVYSYKDYAERIVSVYLSEVDFKNHVMEHVYPIFYGTILLNSDDEYIVANTNEDFSKIMPVIKKMPNNSIRLNGNYMLIKNSTSFYSSVSIIRIFDVLKSALHTGSFLLVVLVLIFIFICVISYYFWFKHKKLISDHSDLAKQHRDTNINHIIQKLFNNTIISNSDETAMNEYLSLNSSNYLLPIVIGISNYNSEDSNDLALYKYGYENIISEIMQNICNVKTTNMPKDLIGILLGNENPFDLEVVKTKIKEIETSIKNNFNMDIFTIIGEETEEIILVYEQIPKLIKMQNYKFIALENSISISEFTTEENSVEYPNLIQTEIIMNINTKNRAALQTSIEKFSNYIIKNKSLNGKEWFLKLFLAISENFHNNNEITIKYNTFETLMNCDKLKNLSDTLYNSIEFSYNNNNDVFNTKSSFEKSMKQLIEKEFSNPNFSLQIVSDHFEFSTPYLGQKFKNTFNTSFNKYLLEYRLKHAITLLSSTNYTNSKIASMCGFNSETYFVTIFKKTMGVSPKEYKNNTSRL